VEISVTRDDDASSPAEEYCPDVYFSQGYGIASASTQDGRWQSLRWEDRLLLPHVVRPAGNRYDAASPYGYSGIHVAAGCTTHDVTLFWKVAREVWRDAGVVAAFLRFSPLDDASREAVTVIDGLRLTRRGDTITIPVGVGADAVWSGMEGRARTAVRKAEKAGLSVGIRPALPDDLEPASPFRRLYEETMRRVRSAPGYIFDDRYYRTLSERLGDDLKLASVHAPDGQIVAASLVLVHRDRVHYHLSGSIETGSRSGANNLLLWTILRWAADTGRSVVHLGGGVRPDDGLFRFKRSFGGERTPFWIGAAVLDKPAYDQLVERRAGEMGVPPAELGASDYFPAYRLQCDRVQSVPTEGDRR
jgi:hypothetical protein